MFWTETMSLKIKLGVPGKVYTREGFRESVSSEAATMPNLTFRVFNVSIKKLLDFELFLFLTLTESKWIQNDLPHQLDIFCL